MRTIPSVTEYSLCSLRWTKRATFTKKFYHRASVNLRRASRSKLGMIETMKRRLALVALLAAAAPAAALERPVEIERAYDSMVAARKVLEDAKQRRERDAEAVPGERAGTAKGASRLLPEYFERQRALERDVAVAQWRYDQALERWNAVR